MKSINFPNIFGKNKVSTQLISDHDATYQNLALMLQSQKTGLFGDPEFGTNLQKAIFEQNNVVLKDLVVVDIVSSIEMFMPQLTVREADVEIVQDGTYLVANIQATNKLDHTTSLYSIRLTEGGTYDNNY